MDPQEFGGQVLGVHVLVTQTFAVQVALLAHVPQLSVPPQPSGIAPQFFPWAAHVVGVHVPPVWQVPPVHVSPTGHPHVIVPPHPFGRVPHALPVPPDPQLVGTQLGWQVPLLAALHVSPDAHEHCNVPPHPSGMLPQVSPWLPAAHPFTEHPHWFAVPAPPHVWGALQVPQLTVPP